MPRLSIIIAHHDDQRLEATLLSVLENRPHDCEIIVAHDGSYCDPYQLSSELVFVETNRGSDTVSKLNEGLFAACAPVVHALVDGVTVHEGWCDAPLQLLRQPGVASVSPSIHVCEQTQLAFDGIATTTSGHRKLLKHQDLVHGRDSTEIEILGPTLNAGFFLRRALLGIGGWCEAVPCAVADFELALQLDHAGYSSHVAEASQVFAPDALVRPAGSVETTHALASISVAFGMQPTGFGRVASGIVSRIVGSLLRPSQWGQAIAWSKGVCDKSLVGQIADRIAASENLTSRATAPSIGLYRNDRDSGTASDNSHRRAA